jgi:ABC-2 type transport system ATP-binding protein
VRELRELGKTVLLTTHYMDEAQALADRIVIINGGLIVAEGTADAIGGRLQRGSTVRFGLPENVSPPVDATVDHDGSFQFTSYDTTADLHRLTSWAIEHDVPLAGLSVLPPTLEDIYLELTEEAS